MPTMLSPWWTPAPASRPVPVEFWDYQEHDGWASNSEVAVSPQSEPGIIGGGRWEDYLHGVEAHVPPPEAQRERISSERHTVAGQPALREVFLTENGREVRWNVMLGNTVVLAVAGEVSQNGLSWEETVAAIDGIVITLRVEP